MQNSARQQYAQHPQGKDIEAMADAKNFANGLLPGVIPGTKWTPTVVNPIEGGSMLMTTGLAWLHVMGWVFAFIFSALVNFRVSHYMTNATNGSGYVDMNNPYGEGATDSTQLIGILGSLSTLLGVLVLVAAAAWFPKDEYAEMGILNLAIQVLTSYGLVASFYIFCHAAQNVDSEEFWLSLIGLIAGVWAQMTLYATSVAINVELMKRAFFPSLAVSVQFISAMAITGDEFKCSFTGSVYANCTDSQKLLSWLVPISTITGVVIMYGFREMLDVEKMKNRPFLRSLILLVYFVGAILSVYKVAMMQAGWDPIAFMFSLIGMMFNFAIVGVVFN